MSVRTSEDRGPLGSTFPTAGLAVLFLTFGLSSTLSACSDDVGKCCEALDPSLSDRIPTGAAGASADIAIDPAFDCASLTCVAFPGRPAYCTGPCSDDGDCPDDFACRSVLTANPGSGSDLQPGDLFCVREAHVCTE
ncbi:MAG: hypothetical protein AAFZ18_35310 [Myxococcota bacterium]